MKLFMQRSVEQSIRKVDDELEQFFATSRKYRSSIRRGSIVLLDDDNDIFDLFMFLVNKCGLDVGVVHVKEPKLAKQAVEDIGAYDVKAVVIDESMIGESINGDSFPSWLSKTHPRIPVWVINCGKERQEWIRSQTSRVGVIGKDEPLASLVETIGFPKECQQFIGEYAH